MSEQKTSLFDKMVEFVDEKLMPPLIAFANLKPLNVIRNAMVATTPMIMVSSIFLILFMLGSPVSYEEGAKPLIGFLAPFAGKFITVHGYCLNFMSLYVAVALGISFANVYGTPVMTTALLSLGSFFAIVINGTGTAGFDATGLFACFVSSFIAGYSIKFCQDHKLTVKLPDTVPPLVVDSFAAIFPWMISITICWLIRVVLNFDIVSFFATTLGPIISTGDSPIGYAVYEFLLMLFWSFGIHGDNVLSPIVSPLTTLWGTENTAAATAGVALTKLPHVWAYSQNFTNQWIGAIYPLVAYLLLSKKKQNKELGKTLAIPTFFICEPLMFGVPIVMNPILFVPMILSATVSGFVGQLIYRMGFINRYFINVAWTVPWPINFFTSTGGDFKVFLIPLVSFAIGMLIWYPFFKIYEKNQEEKKNETA